MYLRTELSGIRYGEGIATSLGAYPLTLDSVNSTNVCRHNPGLNTT